MKNLMRVPQSFTKWDSLSFIYSSHCHCTSVTTDLESYLVAEALEQECLDELTQSFIELGLELEKEV